MSEILFSPSAWSGSNANLAVAKMGSPVERFKLVTELASIGTSVAGEEHALLEELKTVLAHRALSLPLSQADEAQLSALLLRMEMSQVEAVREAAARLHQHLSDPRGFRAAVLQEVREQLTQARDQRLPKDRTISLVLFRDIDHDGEILESFRTQVGAWERALKPNVGEDRHVAIVPPPSARAGVYRLARDLGAADLLPCVVFLGASDTLPSGGVLTRLGARPIRRGEDVPTQLRDIYQTAYAEGAIAEGSAGASLFDRWKHRLNPWALLELTVGACFGTAGAQLVAALNRLTQPPAVAPTQGHSNGQKPRLQLLEGTVSIHQDGVKVGEIFVAEDIVREYWVTYSAFDAGEDMLLKRVDPGYSDYPDFRDASHPAGAAFLKVNAQTLSVLPTVDM